MEMNWSRWFRCESSFGLLLVPTQPGIYALAQEIVPSSPQSQRMLAVIHVDEAGDLAQALSRLFTAGSRWRHRLVDGRCFLRYAVVPEAGERRLAAASLKQWLNSRRDAVSRLFDRPSTVAVAEEPEAATVSERAVDRVARARRYEGVFPARA
jgi:hypothetical protein